MDWKYDKYWSLEPYSPRKEQKKIINEIMDAFQKGYTNIILEAGTGIGKSAIATTIARMVQDSYICTMTNQLQTQYLNDFKYMLREIKGRRNYSCNYNSCCDNCEMEILEEKRCEDCDYILALKHAQQSKTVITNYDYLYYSGNYAQQWDTRELLILDEAHNFENKIMNLLSNNLNRRLIYMEYGIDIFDWVINGGNLKDIQKNQYWIDICERLYEKELLTPVYNSVDAKKHQNKLNKYNRIINQLQNTEWVVETPKKKEILKETDVESSKLKVEFKPLTITNYSEYILQFGEKRLFLTGTLGDKNKFCEWIGIDPNNTYHIYQKSPFLISNRPIYKNYFGSMSNGDWENLEVIDIIRDIIQNHYGEKGVIHTSSNRQAWWIKKQLNSRLVWVVQGDSRDETIEAFEDTDKSVILVGAGIKDGVDFKHGLCRFQILFKIPYPNLGSAQINKRRRIDPVWYNYQTIMPLMQSYGRGIRDEEDYCSTYVLDSDFEKLLSNYEYLFNEYFLEAIQ